MKRMKQRSILSMLAVVTLLLPLIGTFTTSVIVTPVSAAGADGQVMTSYEYEANAVYSGIVTQYTYSLGDVVQQSAAPPTEADWVTPSNYNDIGWGNSWNEQFTYSNFGQIVQTNDPMSIPPTAAWATISYFQAGTSSMPIHDTVYRYSVNGTDVQTATDALDIPPNAQWAALASLNNGWHQTGNHTFSTYTLDRTAPSIGSFTTFSNSGHSVYAKSGNEVTIALQTDTPIASPVLKIAGVELPASRSGTIWSASFVLTGAVDEGALAVSASIYAEDGAPGPILSTTTDGSSIVYDNTSPTLSYSLSPGGATNQNVAVQVAATDESSGVELTKWASGAQTEAYFAAQGTAFTSSFMAADNGTYTVYARDHAGNEALLPVTVSAIDRESPTVSLAASATAPTNTDITVTTTAADNVTIAKRIWADGSRDAAYFQAGNGALFTDHFDANANGIYSVYVEDTAGNHALTTITISNLFKQAPEITLTPSPDEPTNETVMVGLEAQAEGEDAGNALAALRWAEGEQHAAFFTAGGGQDVMIDLEFEGSENGRYSVYARDMAGNETIRQISVTNIMLDDPTLLLSLETTEPIGDKVAVSVEASALGEGNSIDVILWAEGKLPKGFFREGLSADITDEKQFDATANGTYTVYARDIAGNEALETIEIDNIRSANAALADLVALNVEQQLPLSPAFHPELLNYTLQVGTQVESIMLSGEAGDETASVTVNGNPLAVGDSASVSLHAGVNTIRIVVTAQLTSVQRTYTIEATRERPASSGSVYNNVFITELNGKLTTGLIENVNSSSDGMLKYNLKLDDAWAIASHAEASGENELRIRPYGKTAPQIHAVTLTLSAKALSQLKERSIRLTLNIGDAIYEMPAGVAANGGGELVVQLKALRQSADAERVLSSADKSVSKK